MAVLEDGDLVYLDLMLQSDTCKKQAMGGLRYPTHHVFSLDHAASDNHLVAEVRPGDRARFPFNDVSCEYTTKAEKMVALRVRGFYTVLS